MLEIRSLEISLSHPVVLKFISPFLEVYSFGREIIEDHQLCVLLKNCTPNLGDSCALHPTLRICIVLPINIGI